MKHLRSLSLAGALALTPAAPAQCSTPTSPPSYCFGYGDRPYSCATVMLKGQIRVTATPGVNMMYRPNQPDPTQVERDACAYGIQIAMSTAELRGEARFACATLSHESRFGDQK